MVLAAGIHQRPVPKTDIPDDGTHKEFNSDEFDPAIARESIEKGEVVSVPEYYGLAYGWKTAEGKYRATLLQYREVTEDHTFTSVEELTSWLAEIAPAIRG